jgi:hypothetical protein
LLLLLLPISLQITKGALKDIPDDIKLSITEYTGLFEKRTISSLIKCKEEDDFQNRLNQANRDFLYYLFQIISIILKRQDAANILKNIAESSYSGSLEVENNIISKKKRRLPKDLLSMSAVLLNSIRVLRTCIIHINDPKTNFIKPKYYTSILEANSNISVCITALDMIFNGKIRASNHNTDKLIKVCNNYAEMSKGYLEAITKENRRKGATDLSSAGPVNDDVDARIKIAKTIGLEAIPKFDPNAIFRLDGIIGKQLQPLPKGKLDSVELVKSVR